MSSFLLPTSVPGLELPSASDGEDVTSRADTVEEILSFLVVSSPDGEDSEGAADGVALSLGGDVVEELISEDGVVIDIGVVVEDGVVVSAVDELTGIVVTFSVVEEVAVSLGAFTGTIFSSSTSFLGGLHFFPRPNVIHAKSSMTSPATFSVFWAWVTKRV